MKQRNTPRNNRRDEISRWNDNVSRKNVTRALNIPIVHRTYLLRQIHDEIMICINPVQTGCPTGSRKNVAKRIAKSRTKMLYPRLKFRCGLFACELCIQFFDKRTTSLKSLRVSNNSAFRLLNSSISEQHRWKACSFRIIRYFGYFPKKVAQIGNSKLAVHRRKFLLLGPCTDQG